MIDSKEQRYIQTIAHLKEENRLLKLKLNELQEMMFKKNKKKWKQDDEDDKDDYKPPKKKGAPVGHPGKTRKKPKHHDEHHDAFLEKCPKCHGENISLCNSYDDHYQEDVVIIKPKVTRFRHHEYWCKTCKKIVHGIGHNELLGSYIGPTAKSIASFLHHQMALPYRKIKTLFKELFGLEFDPSSCPGFDFQMRKKGETLFNALKENLKKQSLLNIDETGWRKNGINHWLWVYANQEQVVYDIQKGRGQKELENVLGSDFQGIIISDFLAAYNKINSHKQRCLVHLLRIIKRWQKYFVNHKKILLFIKKLKKIVKEIIHLDRRFSKKMKPKNWIDLKADLRGRLKRLLQQTLDHSKAEKWRLRLIKYYDQLTTCLDFIEVPSHNNHAERLLRNNVIMRKITFGNRSESGIQNHQTLMSLIETAKLKNLNPLDFLFQLITGTPQTTKKFGFLNSS